MSRNGPGRFRKDNPGSGAPLKMVKFARVEGKLKAIRTEKEKKVEEHSGSSLVGKGRLSGQGLDNKKLQCN